jgi:hypothetical protein
MLYKCANQACNTPFRRLREGKLFQVETEYFPGRGPAAEKRGQGAASSIIGFATSVPHLSRLPSTAIVV